MRWAGHVTRMGLEMSVQSFGGKIEGKRPLGTQRRRWEIASNCKLNTDTRRLTTEISEKGIVTRFRRCANVMDCAYTNLDSINLQYT
jgi:hypothetical protein